MTIQHFSHVGICVSNLAEAQRFYCEGLGFREVHRLQVDGAPAARLLELEAVSLRAVYLERDGVRIELLDYPTPGVVGDGERRPMNGLGLTHLSLRIDDIESALAQITAAGGQVVEASRTGNPEFNAWAIFVLDPDGTRIELVQSPGDPTRLPGA